MRKRFDDLTGAELDYWTGKAAGLEVERRSELVWVSLEYGINMAYSPSTDWSQGGPLIEQFGMNIECVFMVPPDTYTWNVAAFYRTQDKIKTSGRLGPGKKILIGVCRAACKAVFGEEVPDEV